MCPVSNEDRKAPSRKDLYIKINFINLNADRKFNLFEQARAQSSGAQQRQAGGNHSRPAATTSRPRAGQRANAGRGQGNTTTRTVARAIVENVVQRAALPLA